MDHTADTASEEYGSSYYRQHCGPLPYDRSCAHWSVFFGGIAETLIRSFRPRRVFDAGCALGFLVEAFWDRGVEAWGRDISAFAISEVRADLRSFCCMGSVADPIEGHFDLITCIEVLEHMPQAAAVQAVKAMTAATNRILFSSSPTDLEEPTHINVKPAIWWLRAFAAEGFAPLMSYDPTFVTPHCIVFERVAEPPGEQILCGYAEIVRLRLQRAERDQTIRDGQARLEAAEAASIQALHDKADVAAAMEQRARLLDDASRNIAALEAELEKRSRNLDTVKSEAQDARLKHQSSLLVSQDALERTEFAQRQLLDSTAWRMSYPLRRLVERTSLTQRRLLRGAAKAVWWCLTLQLGRRLRDRRRIVRQTIQFKTETRASDIPAANLSAGFVAQMEAAWYIANNPDVAASGMDARKHYRLHGLAEGRSWSLPAPAVLAQQASSYLLQNPDVAALGIDPVQHFLRHGLKEGRAWPVTLPTADEIAADKLPWVRLLNLIVDPACADRPALNVLIPSLAMRNMSGGPNTAVNVACRLAATGIRVRLVSITAPHEADHAPFWEHATKLVGFDPRDHGVELVDAANRGTPFRIGADDLFMATAWWTAQAARYAVRLTRQKRFLYLIQDYESLLHPASTQQALAEETYSLDHLPIINTRLLYDYLTENRIGRFADPGFAADALIFEPAVDTTLFFPATLDAQPDRKRRRLLFYARPTAGLRNLFELGVAALRKLVIERAITHETWEICGMGEAFDPILLGENCWLESLPWTDFSTYAQQMRESDVLLSLMLSPHPSYPPLEMAACGRPVVTTVFGCKDAARLAAISPNIIAVKPTLEAIAEGLLAAIGHVGLAQRIDLPQSWSDSLNSVLPRLHDRVMQLQGAPADPIAPEDADARASRPLFPGFDTWPADRYGLYRQRMLADRSAVYTDADPALLSFVTTVWNTAPQFLFELARTVFGQDSGPGFEWVILDNGSTLTETRAALATISEHAAVRLFRVEDNIGIIAGLHFVLRQARHRYIVPLDSDDLLTPDCIRVMTSALRQAGLPLLAYSDEDKVMDGRPRDPYCKPDWDPVLFTHSCYIAHLCAINREAALSLDCYTNSNAEGSSDWDSFTRFLLAGHTPLHVPELLYTWRMHPQSTSMNMASKSYIHESQLSVLRTFLAGRAKDGDFTVEPSPLFQGTPDWRFVRSGDRPRPITTVLFGPGANATRLTAAFDGHPIDTMENATLVDLMQHAEQAVAEDRYLHLLSAAVAIDDDRWADEALTMFELYPGTAMVAGRIHRNGSIVAADAYFGFDGGFGSPNIGRSVTDVGYFAQLAKPHMASTVPVQHCVIDSGFLVDALPALIGAGVGFTNLSAWLGAAARMRNLRCVYSPFISAMSNQDFEAPPEIEVAAFKLAHLQLIPDRHTLSPRLGLTRQNAYQPVLRAERLAEEHIVRTPPSLRYPEQHAAELMARRATALSLPNDAGDVSILTTLYIRTDAELFRVTADSVQAQTRPSWEWVILAHGPITPALEETLVALSFDARIRILRRPVNLGIIGGMRLCLEQACGRFVVPLDGDDLLTVDALQLLTEALTAGAGADFAYSDEDILSASELQSPIRRTGFDPILNDADSTIWHLCGFSRDRALQLGVYSDPEAEACHDWDTVRRFSTAGAVIKHVPHVLYHWRHHAASSSGSGVVNEASLRSVQHILSSIIARQARPCLYEVRPYPLFRGVEQFAVLRRRVEPLSFCLIYVVGHDKTLAVPKDVLEAIPLQESRVLMKHPASGDIDLVALQAVLRDVRSEYLVILHEELRPCNDEGPWDAMRLFEMHPDVVAVGGRILDKQNRVVACGETLAGQAMVRNWVGRPNTDPGVSALALKPQTATSLPDDYFFCRTALLRAICNGGSAGPPQQKARRLLDANNLSGTALAYSPLVEAAHIV